MPARKIDFGAVRAQLSFEAVLGHYKVHGREKGGGQWQGYCPLPSHEHKGDGGKPRSPSFSVNLSRDIYHCFGCGGKGNVLEFVIRMEGFDPGNGEQFRKGALRAADIFLGGAPDAARVRVATAQPRSKEVRTPEQRAVQTEAPSAPDLPIVVNAPLDFVLQGLDPAHQYLRDRGFNEETIALFGLGYCSRGLMKGRIAIPLHDAEGRHIGYAGRIVADESVDEDHPKYRFPGDRVRDGTKYVFRKSAFLYNWSAIERHGIDRPMDLILVEGFPSVWWLTQCGMTNVAAVMGSSLSVEQAALIAAKLERDDRVWIMPDGDQAGERLAESALKALAPHCFVHWVRLGDDQQPTDFSVDELADLYDNISA